ncbi:thioesterase [Malaciobacter halophilus]|uniref:Thioesterase n=1 Tax=Malaciobacter halophilus TaxID=197482 RepID=A0A2N1J0X5_9BACT|nr:YiiD C-terminal domain-containing protein [Malaciobacter halophilus]AXH09477.1 putative thioesterase (yiiD_Cterm domain) [Malaciobacter halophilus]PKI80215.1 thioesterase [Malaciobacter halophilus]
MDLNALKHKLHTQIPLTKFMQIDVKNIEDNCLITTAPLKPNINDKLTGFAGSLSTLVTISAWSACYLNVIKLGFKEDCMIAVIKSDTAYRAPVTKELYCKTILPSKEQLQTLKRKLQEKKSASIRIKSQLLQDDKVCVDFEGIYVIKI